MCLPKLRKGSLYILMAGPSLPSHAALPCCTDADKHLESITHDINFYMWQHESGKTRKKSEELVFAVAG